MPLLFHKIIATLTILAVTLHMTLQASATSEFTPYADTLAVNGIINGVASET